MKRLLFTFFLCGWASVLGADAQEVPQAFRGATLYPISSEPIEDGVLVVRGGTIESIGAEGDVEIPSGAKVHDVSGMVILPGLVDTHSHVGNVSGGDYSASMHPGVRALDVIDVRSPSLMRARAGGITTVNIMPGSGLLMSGQTAYLKLRAGNTIEDLLFCSDPLREVCGGMKMANGTNPLGSSPHPGTRAKAAAIVRQQFYDAIAYREQNPEGERPGGRENVGGTDTRSGSGASDLGKEALLQVLDGERTVHFHTHSYNDVMTALRLQEEFGFKIVLHHVSEAWMIADEIAEAGVPASIIVLDAPGGKVEAADIRYVNGAELEEAGVPVAYHTDDSITDSRLFLRSAAFGVRGGMSRETALASLTLAGAKMLNLEHRVGSLDEGKDADFVILTGDPLSVYTQVSQTWVEGEKVFDRSHPDDRRYATGGYDVYDEPQRMHHAPGH